MRYKKNDRGSNGYLPPIMSIVQLFGCVKRGVRTVRRQLLSLAGTLGRLVALFS